MRRVTISLNDSNKFISVEADEFHEDGNFVKAYKNSELVAMVDTAVIKTAHISEQKE